MAIFIIRNWDNDLNRAASEADRDRLLSLYSHPLLHRQQNTGLHQQQREVEKSDDFVVSVDVQHFAPEEVTVKMVDKFIEIEAKHVERPDEHGYVSRYFKRRCPLPDGYNADSLVSKLSSDGVLTIRAPKVQQGYKERIIPIVHTGPHCVNQSKIEKSEEKSKL